MEFDRCTLEKNCLSINGVGTTFINKVNLLQKLRYFQDFGGKEMIYNEEGAKESWSMDMYPFYPNGGARK